MISPSDVVNSEGGRVVAQSSTLLSTFALVVLSADAALRRPSLAFSQRVGLSSKYSIPLLWLMLFSWVAPGADAQAPPPPALWRVAPMPTPASDFMKPPLASDVEQPDTASDDMPLARRLWPEGSATARGQHGRAMQSFPGFDAAAISSHITCSAGSHPADISWNLTCSDGAALSGGAPHNSVVAVALGATCNLHMADSYGDGWIGAEWTGFALNFSLATGLSTGAESFVVEPYMINSAAELHVLLATNLAAIVAYLTPGTHLLGTTFVVRDGKRLTLRSDGAVLDAQGQTRHFLVQDEGVLELEGVRLINGRGVASGGAILARRSGTVRLREVEIENSTAISASGIDGGKARGGAIAIAGEELERVLMDLATGSGHTDWVYSVAYSPDGSRIVSSSRDSTVKV